MWFVVDLVVVGIAVAIGCLGLGLLFDCDSGLVRLVLYCAVWVWTWFAGLWFWLAGFPVCCCAFGFVVDCRRIVCFLVGLVFWQAWWFGGCGCGFWVEFGYFGCSFTGLPMCLVLWFVMIVFALVGVCWCFRLVLWWVCDLRVLVFWWSWWLACGCFVWWVCGTASLWCLFAFLDFGWICGVIWVSVSVG